MELEQFVRCFGAAEVVKEEKIGGMCSECRQERILLVAENGLLGTVVGYYLRDFGNIEEENYFEDFE